MLGYVYQYGDARMHYEQRFFKSEKEAIGYAIDDLDHKTKSEKHFIEYCYVAKATWPDHLDDDTDVSDVFEEMDTVWEYK